MKGAVPSARLKMCQRISRSSEAKATEGGWSCWKGVERCLLISQRSETRSSKVSRPHVRRTSRVGGRAETELDARVELDSMAGIRRFCSLNHLQSGKRMR